MLEEISAREAGDNEVCLYQAVPKGKHMDLLVEKTTELGVGRVVPLSTERSIIGLDAIKKKVERWRRVAEAAARQSLQFRIPRIAEPITFKEALREAGERGVLLHNEDRLNPLERFVGSSPVSLFVGPEGGWSETEIEAAREAGLVFASLGPYRLRSETAGMVAVARTWAAMEQSAQRAESWA